MRWLSGAAPGRWSLGHLPIRWRLALFYAGLSAAILLLLGLLLYRQLDTFLVENTAARLRSQAEPVLNRHLGDVVVFEVRERMVAGTPAEPERAEQPSAVLPSIGFGLIRDGAAAFEMIARELTTRDSSALVLDQDGLIVAGGIGFAPSPAVPLPPLPPPSAPLPPPSPGGALARAREAPPPAAPAFPIFARAPLPDPARVREAVEQGDDVTYVAPDPDGGRMLVTLTPLRRGLDGEVVGVLQLATSLDGADDLLARLRLLLLFGLGSALAAGIILGVPLTRAALRPLDRLVATTEQIAADDLAARSWLPHGKDEIGRLAAAFDRMLARLQASFQAQRQFVADAAHELRTPLTAMSGLIELLLLGADNEDRQARRRTLVTVDRDLSRLTRLVNDLLALSRHDLAVPHDRKLIDLAALTADIHALTAELATDRTVTIERPPVPVPVMGDPDQLRQVLLNLAENARRYTPAGGSITFRVRRIREAAEMAVSDTGPGIPPEDLPRIFGRFYRGDRARTRDGGGSGLGLAIARAIAEAHGGTLTAESCPGEGATFILRLPLAESPNGTSAASAAGMSASSSNL